MNVSTNRIGVATYLSPDAPLVDESLVQLEVAIEDACAAGARDLVFDLKQVPFIDSKGLELILDVSQRLQESGGSLRLSHPNPLCRDILKVSRVDQHVPVFEKTEDVGRSLV